MVSFHTAGAYDTAAIQAAASRLGLVGFLQEKLKLRALRALGFLRELGAVGSFMRKVHVIFLRFCGLRCTVSCDLLLKWKGVRK